MIRFLLNLPIVAMALLVIGATIALAWLLVELSVRYPDAKLKASFRSMLPPFGSAMIAGFVIFSALLANTVWRDKDFAQHAVSQEARALSTALRLVDAIAYPEWRSAVATYVDAVLREEWQSMSDGIENERARRTLDKLQSLALTDIPDLPPEIRKVLIEALKEVEIGRQNRLSAAVDGIPEEVWLTVMLTGLVALVFAALIHAHDPTAARIVATLYGLMIGSMMFSIIALDRPFIGKVSISNEPIAKVVAKR